MPCVCVCDTHRRLCIHTHTHTHKLIKHTKTHKPKHLHVTDTQQKKTHQKHRDTHKTMHIIVLHSSFPSFPKPQKYAQNNAQCTHLLPPIRDQGGGNSGTSVARSFSSTEKKKISPLWIAWHFFDSRPFYSPCYSPCIKIIFTLWLYKTPTPSLLPS